MEKTQADQLISSLRTQVAAFAYQKLWKKHLRVQSQKQGCHLLKESRNFQQVRACSELQTARLFEERSSRRFRVWHSCNCSSACTTGIESINCKHNKKKAFKQITLQLHNGLEPGN
eukprot:1154576-Pelagomonas_calceolata.AAC.4